MRAESVKGYEPCKRRTVRYVFENQPVGFLWALHAHAKQEQLGTLSVLNYPGNTTLPTRTVGYITVPVFHLRALVPPLHYRGNSLILVDPDIGRTAEQTNKEHCDHTTTNIFITMGRTFPSAAGG